MERTNQAIDWIITSLNDNQLGSKEGPPILKEIKTRDGRNKTTVNKEHLLEWELRNSWSWSMFTPYLFMFLGVFWQTWTETCFWRQILDQEQDGIATQKRERNQKLVFSLWRVQSSTFLKIYSVINILAKWNLLVSASNKLERCTGIRTIIPSCFNQ